MTETPSKPLRVLIVEDSEDDTQLLLRELRRNGYAPDYQRVDNAVTLQRALDEGDWDVILADFSMPRFSGVDALRHVRSHGVDVPFLFVSGTIGEDTAVQAMKAGAQDYIMKGNLKRVVPAVERELAEARMRRDRRQSEGRLRKLSRVVEQASESVFITDQSGVVEYVNPAFERLTGYSMDDMRGQTPALLKSDAHDAEVYAQLWRTIAAGEVFKSRMINRRKDGTLFVEEKIITPLKDNEGQITHFVSTGRDITKRLEVEEERGRLAAILEATIDLVAILDPDGALRFLNASGRKFLGLDPDESLSGRTWSDLFSEHEARRVMAEAMPAVRRDGVWSGEALVRGSEGRNMPVSQVILAHRGTAGEVEYLSTIARDISERKRFEAQLRHRATHDALTGLANRVLVNDRIETAVVSAQRQSHSLAVLILDVDNFKRVNETLGHEAGDTLLRYVARQLDSCLQANDTLARHGSDEFTLVVDEIGNIEDVLGTLRKVKEALERPAYIDSHELFITSSIGIAVFPYDGRDAPTLMRNAEAAMHQAKEAGRGQYRFYAPDMNARGHELLALETELRRALERDQFVLHYQPQVDLRTRRIHAAEAVIRWHHPQRGMVSPAHFVPMLEETGLIVPVGDWVLRQACADAARLGLRVSVNVSAPQFEDPNLVDRIGEILGGAGCTPNWLELEITENILMRDGASATAVLERLHELGVRLAVDDFGTGYSSLAYLKRFPLDVLKIDQTFIQDVTDDLDDAAIVEASISLSHKLGLEAVAEGVESRAQLRFLRKHRCDIAQGFYLSRPAPREELEALLRKSGGKVKC